MTKDLRLTQATTNVGNSSLPGEQSLDIEAICDTACDASPVIEGIYAHVPFCAHRCHYCDFFTIAGREDAHAEYVDRIIDEIDAFPESLKAEPVKSIFVGGGTPTILPVKPLSRFLETLKRRFADEHTEFTVEANPETVDAEVADALVHAGVNRVSLGAQSFQSDLLETLERRHQPGTVASSLAHMRAAGIESLSIDLIFGIPGQDLAQWQHDLEAAIDLDPGHLSCYGLIYEPGTPLRGRLDRGEVNPVPEEDEASMYEWTIQRLEDAGYEQYEISNWSRPGLACRHNLLYWQNGNWWAFGPSGSAHVNGWRWRNLPRLGRYLDGSGRSTVLDLERLDEDGRIGETFMMGLRCIDGIALEEVDRMLSGEGGARRRPIIERHVASGLLLRSENRLRLSGEGLLLANVVVTDLLAPGPDCGTET
ncbi:MAG: coproporphyrinogen III oxidase [Phycisphaerae bacterium]|nr:coproporphyrinogen III oxidase [Phycisphaerae bacterium]